MPRPIYSNPQLGNIVTTTCKFDYFDIHNVGFLVTFDLYSPLFQSFSHLLCAP